MRIDNGTVVLRNHEHKIVETLDADVDFSLAWPSISKSFGATGHFVWHDEPVDASITLADFRAALAGNRTGLKLRIAGQADEGRVRRLDQRQADAQDRRHARRRCRLAARRA